MASFSNSNLSKVYSALRCQQKLYISACCHRNNYLEAAEQSINKIMIPKLEDMAVEDIMNGGEHNIKNVGPKPELPVLVIDGSVYCSYQTAKKTNILGSLGCPLEGNFDPIAEGKALLEMINDLRTLSPADFVKKYPIEGEFFNGSARLISMLEKLYKAEDFEESSYTTKLVEGNVKFDNRAKAAVMQFINANENNKAKYENGILYYNDAEITTVGAELIFRRNDTAEDFALSKLTLRLFVDSECSRHYPFEIALGSNENVSCRSLGKLFTDTTYTRYADKATESRTGVWHIPAGMIREKACGGPSDKRTINQMLNDYDTIIRKTASAEFISDLMNNKLSDEEVALASELKDYEDFMEEWRSALDFVQYSTLTIAMPNSWRTENYRVASLFENKDEYIRYFTLLTGGFSRRIRPTLLDRAEYPKDITPYISFHDLEVLSGATVIRFRDEANAIVGNRADLCDIMTVPELKELINATKPMRSKHGIKNETLVVDSFNALFKADREGTAYTIFKFCKPSYLNNINYPENNMHKFAQTIGNYLYYNATMTIGDKNILIPAGRVDYMYDEEEGNHKIYIRMAPQQPLNQIIMTLNNGKLLSCCNEIYVNMDEQYSHEMTTQEDIDRYIPYPEIRTAVAKYLLS